MKQRKNSKGKFFERQTKWKQDVIENKARQARLKVMKEEQIQKQSCTFKPKLLTKKYNEDLRNQTMGNQQEMKNAQRPEERLLAWAAARDAKRNALKQIINNDQYEPVLKKQKKKAPKMIKIERKSSISPRPIG